MRRAAKRGNSDGAAEKFRKLKLNNYFSLGT